MNKHMYIRIYMHVHACMHAHIHTSVGLQEVGSDPALCRGRGILPLLIRNGADEPPVSSHGVQHLHGLVSDHTQLFRILSLHLIHCKVWHLDAEYLGGNTVGGNSLL